MPKLINMPNVKLGVVGVSRDCFPASLAKKRLTALIKSLKDIGIKATKCSVVIENETDTLNALDEMDAKGINAVVIYLGNFGPEGPTTIFAENFPGPVMVVAAAEERKSVLASERGDALCGMLNCSYNLNLRGVPAYIPQMPVGLPDELAKKIADFVPITGEIRASYEEGSARNVRMHDGSVVRFRKVRDDYDSSDRDTVYTYLRERQAEGELPTGLLFLEPGAEEMHDVLGTVDGRLFDYPFEELCPGSAELEEIQGRFR